MSAQILHFPVGTKEYLVAYLNSVSKMEIEEVICIIKYRNGDTEVMETDASFEFKCLASKLLDFEIKQDIEDD